MDGRAVTGRQLRAELGRKWAKWVVVVGMLWAAWVVYIYATTELWWNAAR